MFYDLLYKYISFCRSCEQCSTSDNARDRKSALKTRKGDNHPWTQTFLRQTNEIPNEVVA